MNYIYYLPCKPGSVYVNVTDQCLNDCSFCIKRDGPLFFGSNLALNGKYPNPEDIIISLKAIPQLDLVSEMVFCGMGEPLLRYDCVLETCQAVKELNKKITIRVDTSGLFWASNKRVNILDNIDILSISLNAENAKKYDELCHPNIPNAYDVLIDFLRHVKLSEEDHKKNKLHFPEIRLSIVDTSEEDYIPASGRVSYHDGTFPVPDFEACKKIVDSFGWPLIVKRLFRDSRDERWEDRSFEELCIRGISPDICSACKYRH